MLIPCSLISYAITSLQILHDLSLDDYFLLIISLLIFPFLYLLNLHVNIFYKLYYIQYLAKLYLTSNSSF